MALALLLAAVGFPSVPFPHFLSSEGSCRADLRSEAQVTEPFRGLFGNSYLAKGEELVPHPQHVKDKGTRADPVLFKQVLPLIVE